MVLETISEGIKTGLSNAVESMIAFLPNIIAAIIILIIGYIVGKVVGGAIRKLLEKAKVGEKLAKSQLISKLLAILNISFEKLMGMLVSIFFYVIFILVAIDILGIQMLSKFVNDVLLYLPSFIAGLLVLIIGLILVEWVAAFIKNTIEHYKIGGATLISTIFKMLLMLVVFVITLDQWRINTTIIYTFITPLAWGVAAAIAVAFGWGFKDIVAEWGKKLSTEITKDRQTKKK
jgi:hypothetical protein